MRAVAIAHRRYQDAPAPTAPGAEPTAEELAILGLAIVRLEKGTAELLKLVQAWFQREESRRTAARAPQRAAEAASFAGWQEQLGRRNASNRRPRR